jgi:hypothetical protein
MNDKNENEWVKKISILKNEFSQILYLICYLYQNNQINQDQKLFLKNLVLLNKASIFNLLNQVKKTKNLKEFSTSIKKLITETNISNTKINNPNDDNDNNKSKHLITISNNTDENNNEEEGIDDIRSPLSCLKILNRK